ncbi:hypothetical protein [Nonomuraea sp. NPDC049646]|uniref:hypothetical protein n=1 Tax=unclassified Nonomuraea TaxID=2593643 RepID=UPI0037B665BF
MAEADVDMNADYWTMADIASYLDVKQRTVHTYRLRGQQLRERAEAGEELTEEQLAVGLPKEDKMLGRTPVWKPQTIIRWPRPGQGAGGGRPVGRARS